MASSSERPWSDYEKNQLLAEIIKAHNPQPGHLYDVISRLNIQPKWEDIPLPPGRSLNASRQAYEGVRQSIRPHMGPIMGPQTPTPMSAPTSALKRPFYEGPYSAGPGGREIRPKPSTPGPSMPLPSPTEHPPKRKRGRPTKAEALAKAEASGVAPVADSPPPPLPPPIRYVSSVGQSPMTTTAREVKPVAPITSGMTIAAMLTPVQGSQKTQSQSGSSSGKRRRARSTRSEPDDGLTAATSAPEPDPYESPYARMGLGAVAGGDEGSQEDTPARATVLRHGDEPSSPPRTTARTETIAPIEKPIPRSSPPRPS